MISQLYKKQPGISILLMFASGGQGGRFLKKLPPLDPPRKNFCLLFHVEVFMVLI